MPSALLESVEVQTCSCPGFSAKGRGDGTGVSHLVSWADQGRLLTPRYYTMRSSNLGRLGNTRVIGVSHVEPTSFIKTADDRAKSLLGRGGWM